MSKHIAEHLELIKFKQNRTVLEQALNALNGDSNDEEHDALVAVTEYLLGRDIKWDDNGLAS